MSSFTKSGVDVDLIIHHLKHYLPAQAPLKDFVHHNTLHAFQHQKFHAGIQQASTIFGYQVYLTLDNYRELYQSKKISDDILTQRIEIVKGKDDPSADGWKEKLISKTYDTSLHQKIGTLRKLWKTQYNINLNKVTHPLLFRLVGAFLDQGISINAFPFHQNTFLDGIRQLNNSSAVKLFKSKRVSTLLNQKENLFETLLNIVVGNSNYYEHYLFDQQFAHPGWSGMVSVLEDAPSSLLDKRTISLNDFITLELLIEIDALDQKFGVNWKPIAHHLETPIENYFMSNETNELFEVYALWQEAFEWSYYDEVLKGLQLQNNEIIEKKQISFQAVFCIDDRECSFRRYLEKNDTKCETYSTAGFFNVAFYFQPEHGKFFTKLCPAPQFPNYLIKETEATLRHAKDAHFNKHTHGFFGGWVSAPTMGFWSAIKLAKSILYPSQTEALISSFKHMDRTGKLSIETSSPVKKIENLQVGFTIDEMVEKVQDLLKGIGLVNHFAPLVYVVGHGASSVNNTHYAGYDCGACSGRAGSVNARVAANMANHTEVRLKLQEKGITIPETTQFIAGLHDTTRDEIEFYDEDILSPTNQNLHQQNINTITKALDENAKERSRRFLMIDSKDDAKKLHETIKLRSLSLFEPRPEWNHATNALCIIGKRENNKHLFLDRRSFLNSYDYAIDTDGKILLGILNAVAPVCGGINLEYYFSKVDNYRLGAGTKLPHNVMGLIGVANGMDGDLRTGLPKQMINIHDPLRLLVTVEHFPNEVLRIIQLNPATYEWFINEWIHLVVIHPENKELFVFKNGVFEKYQPLTSVIKKAENLDKIFECEDENLPVYHFN